MRRISRFTEVSRRVQEAVFGSAGALSKLERGLLGQKAERLDKNDQQLSLAILQTALGNDAAVAMADSESEVKPHKRRKPTSRRPLPEHLPRVDIEVLPPEVREQGLAAFERISEEITEIVERGFPA